MELTGGVILEGTVDGMVGVILEGTVDGMVGGIVDGSIDERVLLPCISKYLNINPHKDEFISL